jgi:hypothetical protein
MSSIFFLPQLFVSLSIVELNSLRGGRKMFELHEKLKESRVRFRLRFSKFKIKTKNKAYTK